MAQLRREDVRVPDFIDEPNDQHGDCTDIPPKNRVLTVTRPYQKGRRRAAVYDLQLDAAVDRVVIVTRLDGEMG
jgi:hypothetical protein